MSKLISAIGKETQNANETLMNGRENLNNIRREFAVNEPIIYDNSFIDEMCPSQAFEAQAKVLKKKSKSRSKSNKSRARSRSKSGGKTKRRSKSRSESRGRSCCSPRRSLSREKKPTDFDCLTCKELKRSRSNSRKRKSEFLEDLLDSAKSPAPTPRSVSQQPQLTNNYDLLQPVLFDKFLVSILAIKSLD